MKFLITNDDGIDAPGIAALADAARKFGEVVVVAPEAAHSGCGHRVTTDRTLHLRRHFDHWWALDGTPADCTRVGLREVAPDCDWVLAGVNAGANLGVDVFMSGTVAAAREAVLLGYPGVALSYYRASGGTFDWGFATEQAGRVIEQVVDVPVESGWFWNVNLPDLSIVAADQMGSSSKLESSVPELVDCPAARGHLPVDFVNDEGRLTYQGVYHDRPRETGDDVDVCFRGNVAVSRLSIW